MVIALPSRSDIANYISYQTVWSSVNIVLTSKKKKKCES